MERTVAWLGVALPEQVCFWSSPGFFYAHPGCSYTLRWPPAIPRFMTAAQLSTRASRGSLSLKNLPLFSPRRFILFSPPLWAEDINIYLKASPRLELLHPYSDPATLTLLVTGADGKPVAQGRAAILLEAPEPGRFFRRIIRWWKGAGCWKWTCR